MICFQTWFHACHRKLTHGHKLRRKVIKNLDGGKGHQSNDKSWWQQGLTCVGDRFRRYGYLQERHSLVEGDRRLALRTSLAKVQKIQDVGDPCGSWRDIRSLCSVTGQSKHHYAGHLSTCFLKNSLKSRRKLLCLQFEWSLNFRLQQKLIVLLSDFFKPVS